jgi:hypothetical protein
MSTDPKYNREKLYDEVWTDPVTIVAKRYGVSDVAIRKACKRLNVPVPSRGYWAKLRAGHPVTSETLPPENKIKPARRKEVSQARRVPQIDYMARLKYMAEDKRRTVVAVCSQVQNVV